MAAEPSGLRRPLCPASCMIGGTSGSDDEALPAFGVPVEEHPDPVALVGIAEHGRALRPVLLALLGALGREDAPESGRSPRPVVVARITVLLLVRFSAPQVDADVEASVRAGTPRRNGAKPYPCTYLCSRANEVVLEGPHRRGGAAAHAGLLVDVLDVVADGLGRDAESSAISWLDFPRTRTRSTSSSRSVSPAGSSRGRSRARDGRRRRAPRRPPPGRAVPPRLAQQLCLGGRRVERRPVRPRLAHRP